MQNGCTDAPIAFGTAFRRVLLVNPTPSPESQPMRIPPFQLSEPSWRIAVRWQEYDGELRACLIRMLAVVLFYGIFLTQYRTLAAQEGGSLLHQRVTAIALAWLLLSLGTVLCLLARMLPVWLKYLTTLIDVALLTALCWVGHGPDSPMVMGYFLILSMAALRFRIGLIALATLASIAGYMALVGSRDDTWWDSNHTTSVLQQSITVASLVCVGWVLGQCIHVARRVAMSYHVRTADEGAGEPC